MIRHLIAGALDNPLVVVLAALALAAVGSWSFLEVNVEAYPDPAPAIIEVVAQYPGASAEEVERLVTVPLEVALAGMPGLHVTRSKSLFGLAYLNNQFAYGVDYLGARQEVINRLAQAALPAGVTPQISPRSPLGEFYRYIVTGPRAAVAADGPDVYALHDLKALQDWALTRAFLRVPRIGGVVSFGGTTKRYEVHPDPARLRQYGVTLPQLQTAIAASNANVGGGYVVRGDTVKVARSLGLIGRGRDPMQQVLGLQGPAEAAAHLRDAEADRVREIREIVLASTNNVPVKVGHVVEGGARPPLAGGTTDTRGVVVGHQTRLGRASLSRPVRDAQGREIHDARGQRVWHDEDDVVQGLVVLRKGEQSLPALEDVKARVRELNDSPGRLPPGVRLEPFYDRTDLIHLTTETVRENLLLGMTLVSLVLLMFLGNVRAALIVAINVPLALLFAFAVLFLRGHSANLLSIGAVDFGIVVDSSVIMVENIIRHLGSGEYADRPLSERIVRACGEVEKPLFFSTLIMVCALLPLLTMHGPEGRIFGPMADTYAFALGGALLLAVTLSPVLCLLVFRRPREARDNFLVRWLRAFYVGQLERALDHRRRALGVVALLVVGTLAALPLLGREFMPELEEGNVWVRGIYPVNVSLAETAEKSRIARRIMQRFPEIELVYCQMGRPDDGTDPVGFYSSEFLLPLLPAQRWPAPPGRRRARTKAELIAEMNEELNRFLPGVDWDFSQPIRDNVMEVLSGVQGENSVKIFGPDLAELERLGERVKRRLAEVRGVTNPAVYRILGQANLEFPIDRRKCAVWNVSVADAQNAFQTALAGKPVSRVIEGEKTFDLTLRWPQRLRANEELILDIPVDVVGHTVTPGSVPLAAPTPVSGPGSGVSPKGSSAPLPALSGSTFNPTTGAPPRRRLRDLVTPPGQQGRSSRPEDFTLPGASMIYRQQGQRMVAVKFAVRGRDLAGTVAEAQEKTRELFEAPYRAEWSGEFQEMEQAERRLIVVVLLSLLLIVVLLYMAFHSFRDVAVILSNVVAVSVGGVWALLLTGHNFNISAAVGFISVTGVAVMNGLVLVSSFNHLRGEGMPLREALRTGLGTRIRPLLMTLLTAIFGLLPAAFSTRIGSQSQRPLAIVVVGGMLATLLLTNLVPLLYSLYGARVQSGGGGGLAH